ncbi:MAG: putative Ig domain-containing protein [Lysobacteraceae bacterium]
MQCQPVTLAGRSCIAAAFALVLRRLAGVGLLLMLLLSALWPAQAMAQLVLSIDDVAASEGDAGFSSVFFDVRLNSPAPPGGIGFEFSTSDGSADTTDYDGTSLNRGRIDQGSRQTRIEISVFGDYDIEADETFFLNLLRSTGATIGDGQAVGTILDDDSTPRRISIGDAVAAEGDALKFSIMLDKAARPGGVSFDVIISDGTAIGGADYQALPTTRITIPQGERQTDVFVASLVDDLDEGEESFHFDIDNVTGAEPGALGALGTITDAAVSRPIIDIEGAQIVEGDSGITPMAYRVTLSEPATQTVSVDYRSFPDGDVGAFTGRVIFRPGETVKSAIVPVAGDTRVESDLFIDVELFDAVNADLGNSYATGIVYNDDTDLTLSPTSLPDGRFGEYYDQGLTASGGLAPYTMAITAGALPPGMQLVLSNGRYYVVGTPGSAGTYSFTVTVTDSSPDPAGPFSISRSYTIRVNDPPPIVLQSSPDTLSGNQFQLFSARIHAAGGVAPYLFAVIGGRLPNGVTLGSDGTLSGTPTESGLFFFTVSATDHVPGIPQTASREFQMSVASAPLSLTPPTLPAGYLNESYSHPLTALGGLPPYAFRLSAGALPPGVQLLSNGAIHGTPTAAGQYHFSVTVSDNAQPNRSEATVAYSVDIDARPLQLDPKTLNPITGGAAFQTFFSARGGTGPYTFSISAGALPSGLSLSSANGALQGAPTAIGSFGFDVQVTDSTGETASGTFQLEVVLPIVTIDTGLPDGQVDNPYSQSVSASGGLQPYTFSVTEGALPPGLELDTRGIVTGVPTAAGSYTFTLTAADNNISFGPVTASRTYTVDIDPSGLVLGPKTLPMASTDVNYFQYFDASGGVAPYTYRVSAGALPPGMFLSFSFLSGTPSVAGTYHFSITATDRTWPVPLTVTREYVLVVELTAIEINPLVFPEATAGRSYGQGVSARGGIRPYHYSLAAGALPPGMSLSDSGYISGTSNVAGHYSFTLRVADSASGTASTATRDFSLTVVLPVVSIFTERLQPAAVGSNYVTVMTAYGGQAPYTYALTAGTLPAGLQLTTQGHLLGTPEVVGSYEITITATDSSTPFGPISGSRSYTLVVEPRRLGFSPSLMPRATEGTPYSVTVQGLNGVAPYRFSVTNGTLPPGLTLSGDGIISGIPGPPPGPASFYQYYFALNITDANGVTATFLNVEIDLSRRAIGVMPRTLPAGVAGTAYHHPFTADNATAPHVFAWESGALPTGLRFDPQTATLSGIPLESGEFPFALRQTDAENRSVVFSDVLEIVEPALTLLPDAPLDGVQATAYAQPFVASGGIAPYRYAIEAGGDSGLPPGLRLGEDGVLQGVPTTAGVFTFGIVATDSTGGRVATTRRTYAMTIAPPSIVIDPVTLPKAIAGLDYAQTMTAYGGTAPYTFSIGAGALPPGLMLSAAGMLSGTPTDPGDSTFTVTATDTSGVTGMRIYTLAVTLPKPAPASRVLSIAAGGTFTLDLTEGASGGPFTAATLVSLSPADAGTARIQHAGAAYRLQFTPTHAFVGKATATFTLSNASATSAPTTVVFDVVPRPDPSHDAEAKRLLDAQLQATQRFANAQIDNFQQRMERMHGAGEGRGFSNGLSATTQAYCPQQVGTIPGRRCERRPDDTAANSMDQLRGKDDNAAFGVWASGMIRSGNHDGRNRAPDIDFETDGVSVGADYRVSDAFAFGGGLGYGRDESDIGDNGSRSESDAFSLALYASYSPGERGFVDALLGYQSLGFDLRRFVATNGNMVAGTRKGTQWFGSVSAGADIQKGAWQFTPYVRADIARADLDAYTEHGDPIFALAYNHLEVDTDTGNLGVRIDYRREASWGLWSPQFRLEYQHDFKGNGAQTMRYADLPAGSFYRADPNDFDRSRLMLGLGVLFNLSNDWSFKFDYRGLIGSGGDSDHGVQLNVDRKF